MACYATPRLIVVVFVDGMTEDNLSRLRPYWSQGGLHTLSEEAYQTTIDFPHWVYGGSETVATLMTGTTPLHHGYAMDSYFARQDRKVHPILEDTQESGIGCSQRLSARALLAPTMTDEMRIRYEQSKIYAVGIHPETTILMAGHGANACCWIDTEKMQWSSTSYYSEGLPAAADEQNINGRFAELAHKVWTPRMDILTYMCPNDMERKKKGFSYDSDRVLKHSPAANTLVIELALDIQKFEHLGEDIVPDMLLIELNTLSPHAGSDAIQSAAQEDIYLSINQDLGFLLEQLSKRIGKENIELLLIGIPRRGMSQEALARAKISTNSFNVDRAAALTATYLMAIYGHERWVDGGYGNAIYLNRTLIEQKRLSLETIQRQVANFIMEFEGVQMAYPTHEAMMQPNILPSINKRTMGDVIFTLEPNWRLMENDHSAIDHVLELNPKAPVLLWSGKYRQWPDYPLQATDIKQLILQ